MLKIQPFYLAVHRHIQGCIFFYNPPKGGGREESKALRAREENQRVKNKGREGNCKGKGRRKRRGKGSRREG